MSNFVIHQNICCFCKKQKLVYNYQCDGTHIQPTNICADCARGIAEDVDNYIEYDEMEEYEQSEIMVAASVREN